MKNQTILDRLRSFISANGGNANGLKTIEDAVKRLNSIPGGGGGGGSSDGSGGTGGSSGMKVVPFPWDDDTQYIEAAEVDAILADIPDAFEYEPILGVVDGVVYKGKYRMFYAGYGYEGAQGTVPVLIHTFSPVFTNIPYMIMFVPGQGVMYGATSGSTAVMNQLIYNSSTNRYEKQS